MRCGGIMKIGKNMWNEERHLFEQFLIKRRLHNTFMNHLRANQKFGLKGVRKAVFFQRTLPDDYILDALDWKQSKKGVKFWKAIHEQWIKSLEVQFD